MKSIRGEINVVNDSTELWQKCMATLVNNVSEDKQKEYIDMPENDDTDKHAKQSLFRTIT